MFTRTLIVLFLLFLCLNSFSQTKRTLDEYIPPNKLSWNDYQGSDVNGTGFHSLNSVSIAYDSYRIYNGNFDHKVIVKFSRTRSFIVDHKNATKFDDSLLFQHELHHYIMAIWYGKRLQVSLNALSDYDKILIDKMFFQCRADYKYQSAIYDEETGHGTNEKKQTEWSKKIDNEYKSLENVYLKWELPY